MRMADQRGEPGHARAHLHDLPIAPRKALDIFPQWRAGADKAHVPGQNVEDLRQFVTSAAAQDAAQPADPPGFMPPGRTAVAVHGDHGAELDQPERLSGRPHPFGQVKHRSSLRQQQQSGHPQHHRRQRQQQRQRQRHVEQPLARQPLQQADPDRHLRCIRLPVMMDRHPRHRPVYPVESTSSPPA